MVKGGVLVVVLMGNVLVEMADGMAEAEAVQYVKEELVLWRAKGKQLDKVIFQIDGDEVVIQSFERSPIHRVRRITGYLADMGNFNNSKRAELADRLVHL
jgi:hypothetical protein